MIPTKEEWNENLISRHGEKLHQAFSEAVVAVCGLGGLGSNISTALARAGVGKLILIDFDAVDITNLHRQQYKADQIGVPKTEAMKANLLEIAPYTEFETYTVRMNEDNIKDLVGEADVICEAFDKPEAKAMLVNTVLEQLPEKYLVAGTGMAGIGPANQIKTRKLSDRFYLCGDGVSDVADGIGLVSARVAVCAAHEAHAVLRILAGEYDV